jgi:hypothetical protein
MSSVTQAMGLDAPAARRHADGKLYLPGSLIRGKIREQAVFLGLNRLTELFGRESGNRQNGNETVEPDRTKIIFTDFIDALKRSPTRRFRIAIDDDRATADDQMLAVLESPYAPGEEVAFAGSVRVFASDGERAEIERQLSAALRAVSSVGSQRTVGFGRVSSVEITADAAVGKPKPPVSGSTLGLILSTSDLVCVAKPQPAGNIFESSQNLPGNALKGAIATTWCMSLGKADGQICGETDPKRRELGEIFHKVRIRHAKPVRAGKETRPFEIPLSVIRYGDEWRDTALLKDDPAKWDLVPSFAPDWKDSPDSLFEQVEIPLELRVRTKIDPGRRRAEDEKLFAYEMLSPADAYKWVSYIDFPSDAPPQAAQQLQELLASGIDVFGKTKAKLRCEFFTPVSRDDHVKAEVTIRDGWYVLVVQTPALLNDPRRYNVDLRGDYADAWLGISDGNLRLSHFRARQELAGGFYQHRRFAAGRPYKPWLLTSAGSVFVLEPAGDDVSKAAKTVGRWLRDGLPIPGGAARFYGLNNSPADWAECPYIRENGFGEIAVNHEVHWERRLG